MKNRLFSQALAGVFLMMLLAAATSCEKMVINDEEEGASVVLQVTRFEQTPFPARTRGDISEICTRLNYLIYNDDGERIREIEQAFGDSEFGLAKTHLPEGRYFIVVLAHSSDGNPTSTNARKIGFRNDMGYTDTFLYSDYITVGDEDVDLKLNMKRITAKVKFEFTDEMPTMAERIRFYYTGGSGTLDAENNGWGSVQSKQAQFYNLTHQESEFEIYTIPHGNDDELNVTVTTFINTDEIKTEHKISGIPVKRNYITTCKGCLFTDVYEFKVTIEFDDSWEGEIEYNF